MATGFQTYADEAGSPVIVDMTSVMSQMQGYVDTNAANGSITIPKPPAGRTAFYAVGPLVNSNGYRGKRPGVTLTIGTSSNTLSWSYSFPSGFGNFAMNVRIHYGYY